VLYQTLYAWHFGYKRYLSLELLNAFISTLDEKTFVIMKVTLLRGMFMRVISTTFHRELTEPVCVRMIDWKVLKSVHVCVHL